MYKTYNLDNRDSTTTEIQALEPLDVGDSFLIRPLDILENAIENYDAPLIVRFAFWILTKFM